MRPDKQFLVICFTLILCCAFHSGIYALDLEVLAGMGNLGFDNKSEKALGEDIFEPNSNFLGSISLSGMHADVIDYCISIERNPLLRNRMMGTIGFSFNYGKIEMGPFIGLFNQKEQPFNMGGAGNIQLMYPGIAYIGFKGGSTFALPGEYVQNEGEASIGFWVPNVVCILSMYNGNFIQQVNDDLLTTDKKVRYQFSADVHSKNVPYTIKIDMGYEELSRSYRLWKTADEGTTDEVKSFYVGFTGNWRLSSSLRLVLGLEMPVYLWTTEPLKKPDGEKMFVQALGGVIWTIPEKEKSMPENEEY